MYRSQLYGEREAPSGVLRLGLGGAVGYVLVYTLAGCLIGLVVFCGEVEKTNRYACKIYGWFKKAGKFKVPCTWRATNSLKRLKQIANKISI